LKNQPKTVIETLAERLRDQAKHFNPSLETAPVVVLWTDDRCDWATLKGTWFEHF